ncbi:MAG: glycoside hydrolase family 28 protein [Bacteroidales bacterium]
MKNISLFLVTLCVCQFSFAAHVNMRQKGAKSNGKSLNTNIINKTISELASGGGGTLFFPAGTYLTGPIELKSNITLDLEAGATLLFSDVFDHYLPFTEMRYEGVVMNSFSPLIYARDVENITIKGEGKLDGQGKAWWLEMYRHELAWRNEKNRDVSKYQKIWDAANDEAGLRALTNPDWHANLSFRFFRPPFFQPIRCKNVRVEGVTIVNSPFWTVNPEFCQNVKITGVTILNPPSPNTDGINPSSCKDVHISDCHISVGDDCITLKSGRDQQARNLAVPCENITITNCTMLAGHGGVVIGSEVSGDVRKVAISNCVFDGTDRGIRLKSTRGRGGIVEEITVSNVVMKNIKKEAIVLNLFYSNMPKEPVSDRTPVFRNIHISNLVGTRVNQAIKVLGIEEMPISDISFNNIHIQSESGVFIELARNVDLNNVRVDNRIGAPFELKQVENAVLNNIKSGTPVSGKPLIELVDCKDLFITGCYPLGGSSGFLKESGNNQSIHVSGNELNRLK